MNIIKTQKFIYRGSKFSYTFLEKPEINSSIVFEIYDNNTFLYKVNAKIIGFTNNNIFYKVLFHPLNKYEINDTQSIHKVVTDINCLLDDLKSDIKFPKTIVTYDKYINLIEKVNTEFNLFNIKYYSDHFVNNSIYSQLNELKNKLDSHLSYLNYSEFKNIPENILERYKRTKVNILINKTINNGNLEPFMEELNKRNEILIKLPWKKITNELVKSNITSSDMNSTYSPIYKDFYNYIGTLTTLTKQRKNNNELYNSASIVVDDYAFSELTSKSIEAPLYILNGEPGTGKTYFAEKLANKIGRKFIKISLGNLSEIGYFRGNSNGPSIILQKLLEVGVSNPVILLDEIDKIHPSLFAELLDILDKKQNDHFYDNYLNVEYDLSKIIFIGTSNYFQNLPSEIISRVKFLQINPYTIDEKIQIAQNIAIDFQNQYGIIEKNYVTFSPEALKIIIMYITNESGVRKLKQEIESLIFYAISHNIKNIEEANLREYYSKFLEDYKYYKKLYKNKEKFPGMVNGLAVSSYKLHSGIHNITCIHSIVKTDTPHIEFLSEVSSTTLNSAKIALRYVLANKELFEINTETQNLLFTISFDQIYIPSDGDSAGIAFATAIVSDLLNKKVPSNWAITGSIDLKGNVQVVGGIKDKIEAAFEDGITNFIIPYENKRDINTIDSIILDKIKIYSVKNYEEIFKLLFK
ncbi:S16 family serine protease [Mycoplasma sp. 005V]|uniref:S16 family serine protease n=1 Tax=unclassified Mycoplasma TaxID=2683645 RepID=UPI003A8BC2A0